jgi:Rod binding domain-containing protein
MADFTTPDLSSSLFSAQQAKQASLTSSSLVSDTDKAKMKTKAKEFESFFIYQMVELMKTKTDSEFDGGVGEDMFRHNLNEQIAKSVTDAGGVGITGTVYKELLKQQEMRASTLAEASATYTKTAQ